MSQHEAPRESKTGMSHFDFGSGGLNSMCCAQTAAPEGKKTKRWEMQKRGDCTIKNIITKCMEKPGKIEFGALQKPPRTFPEPSKIEPGSLLGSIWQPGGIQERARDTQEAPRRRPKGSKSVPRAPKSRPRGVGKAPKPLQNQFRSAPGINFRTLLAKIVV